MASKSKEKVDGQEGVQYRRTSSGTMHTNVGKSNFYTKHGIVPISDRNSSKDKDRDNRSSTSSVKVTRITRIYDGSTRFPKLEECAHFHYEFVELTNIQLEFCTDDDDCIKNLDDVEGDVQNVAFLIKVCSNSKVWLIHRTYENFCTLDRQLHRCIFDRKYSNLPQLRTSELKEDNILTIKLDLDMYISRLSEIAGNALNCGPVLGWFEMDNRGHRLIVGDDSAINTPAIAAGHVVKRYTAQAPDELSFQVDDIISIIDMPPATDTTWWRGKKVTCTFEVGFFPSECVELIGDMNKIPQTVVSKIPLTPPKPVLRKRGKLISFLRMFFTNRPARNTLKRTGIVKERVFGCDLGEHLLNSGHDVPLVLKSCTDIIESHGIVDGIYRLSGVASNTQKLRNAFDEDRVPDLTSENYLHDIHSISSLLKMYFRELPNPLLTYQLYDKFADAVLDKDENRLFKMYDVIQQLPPPHYRTTEYLMNHLSRVAEFGAETGMHHKNIAIVWAPNLLRSKELENNCSLAALQGVSIQAVVTEFLIRHVDILFSDQQPVVEGEGGRQSRPKSLALATPTKLLSLEEARERAQSVSSNHAAQKYIEVGAGPEALPEYHTVIDIPGKKKKKGAAGQGAWRSIFSRGTKQNWKRRDQLEMSPKQVVPLRMSQKVNVELEKPPSGGKQRKLRSVQSADSLLLESNNGQQTYPRYEKRISSRVSSDSSDTASQKPPRAPRRSLSFEPKNAPRNSRLSSLGETGENDNVFRSRPTSEIEYPSPIKLSTTEELLSELEGRLLSREPQHDPYGEYGFRNLEYHSEELMTRSLPPENELFRNTSVRSRSADPPQEIVLEQDRVSPLQYYIEPTSHMLMSDQNMQMSPKNGSETFSYSKSPSVHDYENYQLPQSGSGRYSQSSYRSHEYANEDEDLTSDMTLTQMELSQSPGSTDRLASRLSEHMEEFEQSGIEGGGSDMAYVEGINNVPNSIPYLNNLGKVASVSSLNSFRSDECRQVRYAPYSEQAMSCDELTSGGSDNGFNTSDDYQLEQASPPKYEEQPRKSNKFSFSSLPFPFSKKKKHKLQQSHFEGQTYKSLSMPSLTKIVSPTGTLEIIGEGSKSLESVLENKPKVLVFDGKRSKLVSSNATPTRKRGTYSSTGDLNQDGNSDEKSTNDQITWSDERILSRAYSPNELKSMLTDSGSIHIGSGSSHSSTLDGHMGDSSQGRDIASQISSDTLPRDDTLTDINLSQDGSSAKCSPVSPNQSEHLTVSADYAHLKDSKVTSNPVYIEEQKIGSSPEEHSFSNIERKHSSSNVSPVAMCVQENFAPTTEISHQEDMLVTDIDGFIENSDCIATQIGAMSVDYKLKDNKSAGTEKYTQIRKQSVDSGLELSRSVDSGCEVESRHLQRSQDDLRRSNNNLKADWPKLESSSEGHRGDWSIGDSSNEGHKSNLSKLEPERDSSLVLKTGDIDTVAQQSPSESTENAPLSAKSKLRLNSRLKKLSDRYSNIESESNFSPTQKHLETHDETFSDFDVNSPFSPEGSGSPYSSIYSPHSEKDTLTRLKEKSDKGRFKFSTGSSSEDLTLNQYKERRETFQQVKEKKQEKSEKIDVAKEIGTKYKQIKDLYGAIVSNKQDNNDTKERNSKLGVVTSPKLGQGQIAASSQGQRSQDEKEERESNLIAETEEILNDTDEILRKHSPTKRKTSVKKLMSQFEGLGKEEKAERKFPPLVFPKLKSNRLKSLSPSSPEGGRPYVVRSKTFHFSERPPHPWDKSELSKHESEEFLAQKTENNKENIPKKKAESENLDESEKKMRENVMSPSKRKSKTGWSTCDEFESITSAARSTRLFWSQKSVAENEPDVDQRSTVRLSSAGNSDGLSDDELHDNRGSHSTTGVELKRPWNKTSTVI